MILAQVTQKPSFLWVLLSPMVYSMMCKHYVIGLDGNELALYPVSMGFFGLNQATMCDHYDLRDLSEVKLSNGLFTATLSFRTRDGRKMKLFAPMMAAGNLKDLYRRMKDRV